MSRSVRHRITHAAVLSPGRQGSGAECGSGLSTPRRPTLEYNSYLLDMLDTRSTDKDRISVLALHQAVVGNPAEGHLGQREAVLLGNSLDRRERAKVGLVPVAFAVSLIEW